MTASERAAGELVADVDTLTAAIRSVDRFLVTERALAEALVAAGFGRIDAARREALLSAADAWHKEAHTLHGTPTFAWLRDRAHRIGRDS